MKPKIAHFRETFLPLSETFIHQFLTNTPQSEPYAITFERRNEEVFPFEPVHLLAYPGQLTTARITASLRRRLLGDQLAASVDGPLTDELRKHRPDVVHAHFGPEGVRVLPACRRLKIPLVVSFYGFDLSTNMKSDIWRKAYQELFLYASAVVSLSDDFSQRLITGGCSPEKVHMIRIGTDLSRFTYSEHTVHPEYLNLLGVARLVQKKGTEYLLEALAIAKKEIPALKYRHIGGGPLDAELRAKCTALGLDDVVTWLGAQPTNVVLEEMRKADALIVPSVTADNGDTEGIPGVIYEAMALGLTVVASRHAGIPEVIVDNVTGFLADEKDSYGLARAVMSLHRYSFRTESMKLAARKFIEEKANSVMCGQQLDKIYADICTSK